MSSTTTCTTTAVAEETAQVTTSSGAVMIQSKTTSKQVRFNSENNEEHMIPQDQMVENAWLTAEECKATFRKDVILFLQAFQRSRQHQPEDDNDDITATESADPCCGRGLESYEPGQFQTRKKIRSFYVRTLLQKYKLYQQVYDDPIHREQSLGMLASDLSERYVKKAHAVAVQDALEAKLIHAEEAFSTTNVDTNTEKQIRWNLEHAPLVRRGSKTEPLTRKARAA